ncbi:hypothetical protein BJX76DRAFT_339146 [Aspergillus varians]
MHSAISIVWPYASGLALEPSLATSSGKVDTFTTARQLPWPCFGGYRLLLSSIPRSIRSRRVRGAMCTNPSSTRRK